MKTKKRGQSLMEYVALIAFIIFVFFGFQKYIVRGLSGKWKQAGDALGQERIYDPHKTIECAFYTNQPPLTGGYWYNRTCFEQNCALCRTPYDKFVIPTLPIDGAPTDDLGIVCTTCVATCQTPICND